ncbi:hypothetical protein BXQ17_07080 [Polaribacter sp. BM10]|uniref:restriction endonuclease subunit S n=1 Tax=Polaribacter sp. BM10 TaxID=1529069 RepID=UPI00098AB5C6|nr:restriction endonuclease subunit S [Polaribacter sp. BM10]AQS93833.1 hypothetical protein BXQ17_07080 [Polaribacter sp. BM10]
MEEQLMPQLRFPEFEGEWHPKKLGSICVMTSSKRVYLEDYVPAGIPFFRGKEITELKNNTIPSDILYISNERYNDFKEKYGVPKKEDILVTAVGTLGNVWKINDDNPFYFKDGNLIWLKNIKENSDFLEKLIQLNTNELIKTSIGSTQKALTMVELRKIQLNFPQFPEQQKIASFLTDVDDKITKLTKKKTLLEQYKKGIMQKIFNQELRFKDDNGNAFPNWEEKKLGVIGSIVSGLTYSPNDIDENGVLVLRSSNVKKRLIALNDNVFVNVEEGKFNPVELNDILICVRNGSKRLIGKNAIIKEEHIGLAFGAFMTVYRSKYNRFLFHFFDSQHYKKEVYKNLGATINSINGGDLKKFKVPFPCIEEQTKIANFLSDIDIKIEALNTKIENSKAFKKGLLQQMFV